MASKKSTPDSVTIRARVGDREIEVTGPPDYAERKVQEFLVVGNPARPSEPTGAPPPNPAAKEAASGKPTSPAQFIKRCHPTTDLARVLVIGYYLEKFDDKTSFTSSEIVDTLRMAKHQSPANTSDAINKNIHKGFIMAAGNKENRMAFVLTADGEEEVERMSSTSDA